MFEHTIHRIDQYNVKRLDSELKNNSVEIGPPWMKELYTIKKISILKRCGYTSLSIHPNVSSWS